MMANDKRITNREYIVNLLNDPNWIDDGWAAYEAMLHYNIKCPYMVRDRRAYCHGKDDDFINRDNCYICKEEWLNREVDE